MFTSSFEVGLGLKGGAGSPNGGGAFQEGSGEGRGQATPADRLSQWRGLSGSGGAGFGAS